ncbi:MAG TPA: glycosyltransferase family 1 protein [Pyrinomonadaceae bacterium]|nr:glycosyltransferase family 1 protein [Pyrinomonadaceae bacterium]
MHIGFDAHSIGTGLGGNETYATNLIEALAEVDTQNRYTLYVTRQEAIDRFANRWPNVTIRKTLPHTPLIRIPLTLAAELRRRPVDILHVQYTAPPLAPCHTVVMIHDLSFEHIPETFKRRSWMQMRITVRRTARSASHVLTDSEYSRQDILRTYGLPPERVTTTPLAASSRFMPVHDEQVLQKYGISGDYILAVGSIQPRKNIARLIRGYTRVLSQHPDNAPKLVIVGKRAWLFEDTIRAAAVSSVNDKILFTDYVPESDLAALYTGALCFAYPSYFEGFGIPLLEAMRCGAPTITSDRTCFPEVVGDASLIIDPFDEYSIADGLWRMISDVALREQLRSRGFVQSSLFDWRQTARLTLGVYEQVFHTKAQRKDTKAQS